MVKGKLKLLHRFPWSLCSFFLGSMLQLGQGGPERAMFWLELQIGTLLRGKEAN